MMNFSKIFLHPNLTKAKTNQKTQIKKVVKSKQKTQNNIPFNTNKEIFHYKISKKSY